jgi:DNA-nicking Smr family endonuclease
MKSVKSSGSFGPFRELNRLIHSNPGVKCRRRDARRTRSEGSCAQDSGEFRHSFRAASGLSDEQLFRQAMADVTPLAADRRKRICPRPRTHSRPASPALEADAEALARLRALVDSGAGFVVEQTPEYAEGTGRNVHPRVSRWLHRGLYAIQDHIDLHGMSVDEARAALDAFLKRSLQTGRQAVLVVHGRGLSSPARPVLKGKVHEWLARSPWKRWVIAFASARSVDGGAGATYVLLRERPLPKRACR